jgi:hypothetical protein
MKQLILGFEAILKKDKIGVWEWSDEEEEEKEEMDQLEND